MVLEVVAPDLPCDDDTAGLREYTDAVVGAIGDRGDLVVVGTSFGGRTGSDDPLVSFYHDVPWALAEEALSKERSESNTAYHDPWPRDAWPAVPTRFVLCTEDRFFPPDFMRRVVAERLGIVPDEIAAGHCVALSRPAELADLLAGYAATTEAERSQWVASRSKSR